MRVSDFEFALPERLIAKRPLPERSRSRLLHLNATTGEIAHHHVSDLPDLLNANDLMVFNNTRVIPARFFGRKASGGRVEILLERVTGEFEAVAQLRVSKTPAPGGRIILDEEGGEVEVLGRDGGFFQLRFPAPVSELAARVGHMPLPPYIDRDDTLEDRERYQTVYASREGAVAAPTAGLHFDDALLGKLAARGLSRAEVTLHVGAGTFQPVRVDDVTDHEMHAEWLEVPEATCAAIAANRKAGGRTLAVGTTSVRALETAAADGELKPFMGDTRIFIYPGYEFRVVDALMTNFHLPGSTLIMLVSALAGFDNIRRAYAVAVEEEYRFFSYGDAMLITR